MDTKHTPGPWRLFIDDTGGQWSGWPLCIDAANDEEKTVVRTGGQWPYEWDSAMSQREALANARLIAAAPELLEACLWLKNYAAVQVRRHPDAPDSPNWQSLLDAIAKATQP